jgi:hypothetical protein
MLNVGCTHSWIPLHTKVGDLFCNSSVLLFTRLVGPWWATRAALSGLKTKYLLSDTVN